MNVGTNTFQVRATDAAGLSDTATMTLAVAAAPDTVATLTVQPAQLLLSWTGGIAPYELLMATNLDSPDWQPVQSSLTTSNVLLAPTHPAAFYRIRGQ